MNMESKGFKKFIRSFRYAFSGILSAFSKEQNMWVHLLVTSIVIIGGFYFQISEIEWLICILWIGIVIGAELFNTALETTVNLITKEKNELAKKAKDISAGAVLVLSSGACLTGFLIFLPKIVMLFS